jgi:hypothetical protein
MKWLSSLSEDLMTEAEFGNYLKRMSEIAKVVNAFTSEAVQRDAFACLLTSLRENSVGFSSSEHSEFNGKNGAIPDANATRKALSKKRESPGTPKVGGGKIDRELNLRPTGKRSFAEFVTQKQPKSNQDRFAVVVYYLEQVLELAAISAIQVRTVFRLTDGWREPVDIENALRVTALRKATIETSDMENIKTTPQGRNFIEHDLPTKSDEK